MKICPQGGIVDTECLFLCRHVFCKRKVTMNFISISVALPQYGTNPVFCETPPFAIKFDLRGWNVLVGLNRLYLIHQPNFGRKEVLLKFSLFAECFTVFTVQITLVIKFIFLAASAILLLLYWFECISVRHHRSIEPTMQTLGGVGLKLTRIKGWILNSSNFRLCV